MFKKKRVSIDISVELEKRVKKIMVQKMAADGIVRYFSRTCVELLAEAVRKYLNAGVVKSEGK